jgi:hypothetical protein
MTDVLILEKTPRGGATAQVRSGEGCTGGNFGAPSAYFRAVQAADFGSTAMRELVNWLSF